MDLSMNDSQLGPAELARVALRAAIAEVELRVAEVSKQALGGNHDAVSAGLTRSWQELVPLIAPEREPEQRPCPHCRRLIVQAATRCKYCFKKSTPPQA